MRVVIVGAGAIGCFVGGKLIHYAGVDVVFVGRPSLAEDVAKGGLVIADYNDTNATIPADKVKIVTEIKAISSLGPVDYILISVKFKDTVDVANQIAELYSKNSGKEALPVVISLQNGLENANLLRQHLPNFQVLKGMVGFGVKRRAGAEFYRGTSNPLEIQVGTNRSEANLVEALNKSGISSSSTAQIDRVQYGKLLINLNNAVCALSNLPLKDEFLSHHCRSVLAAAIEEGLEVYKAHGIVAGKVGALNPFVMIYALRLPTFIFSKVASKLVTLKGDVYSSMWDDLQQKRETEIEILNGEISRLGKLANVATPVNDKLRELVKSYESTHTVPSLAPKELASKVLGTAYSSQVLIRLVVLLYFLFIFVVLAFVGGCGGSQPSLESPVRSS